MILADGGNMIHSNDFTKEREIELLTSDSRAIECEPILTIEQAKKFYIAMGCSHFHIDREYPTRRDEYRALHISSELENQWKKEEFLRMIQAFPYSDQSIMAGYYFSLKEILAFGDEKQLELMVDLLKQIHEMVPLTDIPMILSVVVGNNATKSHGGLIERACSVRRYDLVDQFIKHILLLLRRVEENNIKLPFLRGNFVDVIVYHKLKVNQQIIDLLLEKDKKEKFDYYNKGAMEGNIFSMRMLAQCYQTGQGCVRNVNLAIEWLTHAANHGNALAIQELKQMKKLNGDKGW